VPRGPAQVERCVYLGKWLVVSGWMRAEEVSGKEGGGGRVPSGKRGTRMDRLARGRKRIRRPLTRNTRRAQMGGLASPPTASKPTLTRRRRDQKNEKTLPCGRDNNKTRTALKFFPIISQSSSPRRRGSSKPKTLRGIPAGSPPAWGRRSRCVSGSA
jgi:hypothetical protein